MTDVPQKRTRCPSAAMAGILKRSWAPAPGGMVDMARGAGVEERRVYETAGKRGGYGDLNAAAGSLLKPRLLSQVTRGLAKAVTARRRVQRSVD